MIFSLQKSHIRLFNILVNSLLTTTNGNSSEIINVRRMPTFEDRSYWGTHHLGEFC